jgi:hypothetical protein
MTLPSQYTSITCIGIRRPNLYPMLVHPFELLSTMGWARIHRLATV